MNGGGGVARSVATASPENQLLNGVLGQYCSACRPGPRERVCGGGLVITCDAAILAGLPRGDLHALQSLHLLVVRFDVFDHMYRSTSIKEFATMAAVCDVCAKGPGFGKSVSHSHRRTNRRWNPNIQTVHAQVAPGNSKRMNVCTSCLKAGKVVRG